MPASDATILDNFFPAPNGVTLRSGSRNHVTGIPLALNTLAGYRSPTASHLFAFAGGAIYDVTGGAIASLIYSPGTGYCSLATPAPHGKNNGDIVTVSGVTPPGYNGTFSITVVNPSLFTYIPIVAPVILVGTGGNYSPSAATTPVVTGLSNPRFQHINFGTAGGAFMYCVNGEDKAQLYNGTAWIAVDGGSTPAITGVATTLFIHVNAYKGRLFFTEKDSLRVWYLPPASVGGLALSVDLSAFFTRGGHLMGMCSWSLDSAAGVEDYAVFVSSEGEVLVYAGNDPSAAISWKLVSHFRMGRPLGRRFYTKFGGNVIIMTDAGFYPLSEALLSDQTQPSSAITDKIVNSVTTDASLYFDNFGWQAVLFPGTNKLIFNVPVVEGVQQYQYVMSTISGAWCRYVGWTANCFEQIDGRIFYGSNISGGLSSVIECEVGSDDNGLFITGYCNQAQTDFGQPAQIKQFQMIRPTIQSQNNFGISAAINVDFSGNVLLNTPSVNYIQPSEWNVAIWNEASWGLGDTTYDQWIGVNGIGYTGGVVLQLSSKGCCVRWQKTDFLFTSGRVL